MANFVEIERADVWVNAELIRKVELTDNEEGEWTIVVTLDDGEELESPNWLWKDDAIAHVIQLLKKASE